jgi:hypothetical protein
MVNFVAAEISYYALVPFLLVGWTLVCSALIVRFMLRNREYKDASIARRLGVSVRATYELRVFGYTGRDQDMRTCTPWKYRKVLQTIAIIFAAYRAYQLLMIPLSPAFQWHRTLLNYDNNNGSNEETSSSLRVKSTLEVLQGIALDFTDLTSIGIGFGVLYGTMFLHPLLAAFIPGAHSALASVGGFGPDAAAIFCEHFYFAILRLSGRLLACSFVSSDDTIVLDADGTTTCFDKAHIAATLFAVLPWFTLLPLSLWWGGFFRETSGPALAWHQGSNIITLSITALLALTETFLHRYPLAMAIIMTILFMILFIHALRLQPCLYNYGIGRYINNCLAAVYACCVTGSICAIITAATSYGSSNALLALVIIMLPIAICVAVSNNLRAKEMEYSPHKPYYVSECFRIGFSWGPDYDSYNLFAEQPRLIIAQVRRALPTVSLS